MDRSLLHLCLIFVCLKFLNINMIIMKLSCLFSCIQKKISSTGCRFVKIVFDGVCLYAIRNNTLF